MPTIANIANVLTAAKTAFPHRVVSIYWGDELQRGPVEGLLTTDTEGAFEDDMGGIVANLRGQLRFALADCDPWTPPADNETIELHDYLDVLMGRYKVLTYSDNGALRRLVYGEDSA